MPVVGERMVQTLPECPSITSLDRNVVLPFTTPLLVGTRARPRHGGGIELVVPNPAGGRGFYVMDLQSLPQFCRLTLHDELLLEELMAIEVLTPAAIRRVARKVAMTGAAGREAAQAAASASQKEQALLRLAHVRLLLKTLEAAGVREFDSAKLDPTNSNLRSSLKSRLARFATTVGMAADDLLDALEAMAPHAADFGFREDSSASRHCETLRRIEALSSALERWASVESQTIASLAHRIAGAAHCTHETAKPLVEEAQDLFDDVPKLLRLWRSDAEAIRARWALCDSLLHGWGEACSLWEAASRETRSFQRATLHQIEKLLPLRKEQIRAREPRLDDDWQLQRCRSVKLYEDWRTGVLASDWLARREALRAGALA
jgi:hypothetical protein